MKKKSLSVIILLFLIMLLSTGLSGCNGQNLIKKYASGTYQMTSIERKNDEVLLINYNTNLSAIGKEQSYITFGTLKEINGENGTWLRSTGVDPNAPAIGLWNYLGPEYAPLPGMGWGYELYNYHSTKYHAEPYYIIDGKFVFENEQKELYLDDCRAEMFIIDDTITINYYGSVDKKEILILQALYTKVPEDLMDYDAFNDLIY
jgi:hypothetical protein